MRCLAILLLTAAPVSAEQIYGSAELQFGQSQMAGAPVALQGADGSLMETHGAVRLGTQFGNGFYAQGDLSFGLTDNANAAPNTYNSSNSVVFHVGRSGADGSVGGFAGVVSSDHDNDVTDDALRSILGAEGARRLGAGLSLQGHLGYLTGSSGTDTVATVSNGVFAGVGLGYALSDRFDVTASLGYINGQMDAPSTVVEAWRFQVRADRDIAAVDGLSAFAAIQYGEYHQKEIVGADDITDITSVVVGMTYRFGGQASTAPKTARLDYLEAFLANTGGVLE